MSSDAPRILLTGAGFTHNFRAPLAEGLWSYIFNHPEVQRQTRIRKLLLKDFDFESVYDDVTHGDYTKPEKDATENAVRCAFDAIDRIITVQVDEGLCGGLLGPVSDLLKRFAAYKTSGSFFTLNQDLFVERRYKWPGSEFGLAGLPVHPLPEREMLSESDYFQLPRGEELDEHMRASLAAEISLYVKLHGSHNWLDSSGKRKMVIGGRKAQQIQQEPLLRWYWDLFRDVLQRRRARMLVIGYGFRDKHVNSVLADAVGTQQELRIYVVSPEEPRTFLRRLGKAPYGKKIIRGLSGYFPYTLHDMFCPLHADAEASRSLLECVFGNR